MASGYAQVEAEVNKQAEETIKDVPVTEEKVATPTDDDEKAEVIVHEEEENGESAINIDDEEVEPDHAPAIDKHVEIEELNQLED